MESPLDKYAAYKFPISYLLYYFTLYPEYRLSYLKEEIILVSLYHALFHLYRNIIIIITFQLLYSEENGKIKHKKIM